MSGKHTPGPWAGCHAGCCPCGQIWGGDHQTVVAKAYGEAELERWEADRVPSKIRQEANARLIIAAPDLLAALREITELCKREPANPFLADNMDRIAIAAIAKAEGKPPAHTAHKTERQP